MSEKKFRDVDAELVVCRLANKVIRKENACLKKRDAKIREKISGIKGLAKSYFDDDESDTQMTIESIDEIADEALSLLEAVEK